MTTLTAESLTRKPAAVRRALGDGEEVLLTFHGKPYGRVISHVRAEKERAELERLRAEVEELRAQLDANQLPEVPVA